MTATTWKDHTLDFPAIIDTKSHMEPPDGWEKFGFALFIAFIIATVAWTWPPKADANVAWSPTQASYYNPTGNATACGRPMTGASWHVASLGGSKSECGDRLVICHRSRCVNVKVQDTGPSYRGRRWDLTSRVKRALRCSDLCNVKWRRG